MSGVSDAQVGLPAGSAAGLWDEWKVHLRRDAAAKALRHLRRAAAAASKPWPPAADGGQGDGEAMSEATDLSAPCFSPENLPLAPRALAADLALEKAAALDLFRGLLFGIESAYLSELPGLDERLQARCPRLSRCPLALSGCVAVCPLLRLPLRERQTDKPSQNPFN